MKINIKKFCTIFLIVIAMFTSTNAQSKAIITNLETESKKNGAFIKLFTTSAVNPKHITGWTSDDRWFYITIFNAIADSGRVAGSQLQHPITDIQVNNLTESTQLAFKINQNIENFEFYQAKSPPEILLSLRFPVNDIAMMLEDERERMAAIEPLPVPPSQAEDNTIATKMDDNYIEMPSHYEKIRTALYLSGASLTVAGIAVEANNSKGLSWKIPTGLAILAGTYLYDKYFYKSEKK